MDKEHLPKRSLYATVSQSVQSNLVGISENMCNWIDKSWYRDTIVQFQHFMQLFSYLLLLMIGIKAANDIIELGWESERE